jgi:hypothetical protein
MVFETAFAERARIDASGNLLVGTTSAATQITFSGSSGRTYQLSTNDAFAGVFDYLKSRGTAGSPSAVQNGDSLFLQRVAPFQGFNYTYLNMTSVEVDGTFTSGQNPPTRISWYTNLANSATTERMRLTSFGDLGIGTTNPALQRGLHVANIPSGLGIRVSGPIGNNSWGGGIEFYSDDRTTVVSSIVASTGGMQFNFGGFERARITSDGQLLVGRQTAFDQAMVAISYNSGLNQGLIIGNTAAATSDAMRFKVSGSNIGSITTSTTATTYNTSSDYRLKTITGPITTSGAYIDSLRPVEGTWKADGSAFVGLIAHEVQEVSRTAVATGTKDGEQMQGMDYSSSEIIANLIAEIQALRARVLAIEKRD